MSPRNRRRVAPRNREARMRPISMDGYMAVVSAHLPPSLVSDPALCRISTVAAKLPPCSLAGFELRLRDDRPEVDFFVRLPYSTPIFRAALLAHPVWQTVQRVCHEISSPSGALRDQVRFVFLEFDLDRPPPEPPVPALFLELHTGRSFSAADLAALASVALGAPWPHASAQALDRCITALPRGANVAHMAVMSSRPGSALRIVIDGLPASGVGAYLNAIGWEDSAGVFADVLHDVAAIGDPVVMADIDVADVVCPKVGIEFYVRRAADNVSQWKAMFDVLVGRGLASPAKAHALMSWPGSSEETATNPLWAENLALGDLLFRGLARSMFWRSINHIKLTYQPHGEPEAKAYLGFGHNWFPIGGASQEP